MILREPPQAIPTASPTQAMGIERSQFHHFRHFENSHRLWNASQSVYLYYIYYNYCYVPHYRDDNASDDRPCYIVAGYYPTAAKLSHQAVV
jgi:hypothetical protein